MHVCMYTQMHVHTYSVHRYTCKHAYTQVHTHAHTHACTHTHTHTHTHARTHAHTHTHTHTHTHMCTHTYTYLMHGIHMSVVKLSVEVKEDFVISNNISNFICFRPRVLPEPSSGKSLKSVEKKMTSHGQ